MSSYFLRKGRLSEDALTGMLADLMDWWPEEALALLARARPFRSGSPNIDVRHVGLPRVAAWPRWGRDEPDLLLEFWEEPDHGAAVLRSRLVIEVKLGAAKSGTDDGGEAEETTATTHDQLGKYYRHAVDRTPGCASVDVVYLTHHVAPPKEELESSALAIRLALGDEKRLHWLSWHEVANTIHAELPSAVVSARHRALKSFAAVLAKHGFAAFSGAWRPEKADALPSCSGTIFWSNILRWQASSDLARPPTPVFWGAA